MNYIERLRTECLARDRRLAAIASSFHQMRVFLNGPKFTGTENGERKDWIATADVIHWLRETEMAGL